MIVTSLTTLARKVVYMNDWLRVDKEGLSKLIQKRGKAFIVFELVQNAWDQVVTRVEIILEPIGRGFYSISVVDDDPNGFADLSHAYTLFAESTKKANPEKRGRFNLGEKLILALCQSATISSTKGCVIFEKDGHRRNSSKKRMFGSEFQGVIRLNRTEYQEIIDGVSRLIPPTNIKTLFNNEELKPRKKVLTFSAQLPTEVAKEDGVLLKTSRITDVDIFEAMTLSKGWIHELGIPVVEIGGPYDLDIRQKIPLNMDRDNVTSAYLSTIRTELLNHTADLLTEQEAAESWTNDALENNRCTHDAIQKVCAKRFGESAVIYDPSDTEANHKAVANGYNVVHGRTFSRDQWQNIKNSGALKPAGQVFATPKPYSDNAPSETIIPENEWTSEMRSVVAFAKWLALQPNILNIAIDVAIVNEPKVCWSANFGGCRLCLNCGRLGKNWFQLFPENIADIVDLLIHEFGHHFEPNHLSENYHRVLTRLAGSVVELALNERKDFLELTA